MELSDSFLKYDTRKGKKVKNKSYKVMTLSALFYGPETWLVTKRDENWIYVLITKMKCL